MSIVLGVEIVDTINFDINTHIKSMNQKVYNLYQFIKTQSRYNFIFTVIRFIEQRLHRA